MVTIWLHLGVMTSKSALMDSARTEILHYERAGARVDRIAKAAKVNKRMLYHYFGSKDGVYRAVLQRQLALLSSGFAPVPTVLQTVCSIYLSELGDEVLDSAIDQVSERRVSSEDFKIAAILCVRAILSLEASSSAADSKTLKYIKSMHPRDQTALFSVLMVLIFDSEADSSLVQTPNLLKSSRDPKAIKTHTGKRQIAANTRPA